MSEIVKKVERFYQKGYKKNGVNYQRKYPNEELCRFMGRNYFSIQPKKRKKIKILETGCGSGGNLWMLSKEGFSTFGIDISAESIKITKKLFEKNKLKGNFKVGNFISTPYKTGYFNCVVDIFSSCSLEKENGKIYIKEVNRILKNNGKFFSYFPSKSSDMFRFPTRKMYDSDTMISLKVKAARKIDHPHRFMHMSQYCNLLKKSGFKIDYKEELMRTYFFRKEKFYFLVIEASKL